MEGIGEGGKEERESEHQENGKIRVLERFKLPLRRDNSGNKERYTRA